MSKYAVYEIFGDSAPYNVEFCGHLAGALVGTSDKNPLSRQHDGVHDSVNEIETKLSKYDSMAREATKQLQEYGLGGFKVIVSWDSEKGFDAFYLKRVGEEDVKCIWIELWDCRYCPNVMELASDAIVAARSWVL